MAGGQPAGAAPSPAAAGRRAHQPAHRQRGRGSGHGLPRPPGRAELREPTAGVPTGNTQYRLPDGAEPYLTGGVGVDRAGRTYETRIRPDQPVATDWTRYGTPADPVLKAATAWLGARCADR